MSTRLPKSERPPWWPWPLGLAVVTAFFVVVWLINREVVPTREPAPTVEKTNEVPAAEKVVATNAVVEQSAAGGEISAQRAQTSVTNNVPEGYRRVQFSVEGTGFATKPQTNLN